MDGSKKLAVKRTEDVTALQKEGGGNRKRLHGRVCTAHIKVRRMADDSISGQPWKGSECPERSTT